MHTCACICAHRPSSSHLGVEGGLEAAEREDRAVRSLGLWEDVMDQHENRRDGKEESPREMGRTRALGSSREDSIITSGFESSGTNDPMKPAAGPQFAGKGEAAGNGATRTSARLLDSCQAVPFPHWCP